MSKVHKYLIAVIVLLLLATSAYCFRLQYDNKRLENHLVLMTNVLANLNSQRQSMNEMESLATLLEKCDGEGCRSEVMKRWFDANTKRQKMEKELTPLLLKMQESAKGLD